MSKKRTSPSSGRLSLNNDFKLSQPDPEFVYNGKNYPDWIFNINLACDAKPILRAMLRGEIDPPDPTKVLHNPDVDAMLTRLKSNVVAFSTKPVPIFFDTSSPDYGTNANGGAFVGGTCLRRLPNTAAAAPNTSVPSTGRRRPNVTSAVAPGTGRTVSGTI